MTDTVDQTPPTVTVEEETTGNDGTEGSAPLTVEMKEVNKPEEVTSDPVDTNDTGVSDDNYVCLKKSVSFPEPSNIACYSEAPDPWKNATVWTTQDLVSYYKIGCDQNNVKPLTKVLTQLQNIDNPEHRYDLLSLKGEKLDIRHCESLEEIFKRVQFRCVDLEGCHLDDETSVALFDMIEFYESACKVNMSFNRNISLRGWQGCARMVRKTPCLTALDARNCDLNERLVPVLGRALRMGCFLTTLHLESTYISGRPLVILVAALKTNETLKELFLADNRLVPTDGIQLGNLLKYNHKLSLLDIRNNHLQDIGIGHVCDGIFEQNLDTGLQTLVLWNNQITYSAMASIGNALSSTENLETLNLGHNNVTNEGIHLIKDGLLKSKSLLRIGLQGTKITCEGAVALAEVVADSPRLLRLDLRENEIKTAGLMALSLALKVNETVTRLDMDRDTKKESGMKDYADQQRRLQQDILNYLERNQQLSRKRIEEERIELERSIKEDTRPVSSESIIEPVESGSGEFIQTFDKVKRPMLLVMQDKNAQQTLDSPYIHPEDLSDIHGKGLAKVVSPSIKSVISSSSPSAELLLSPQYSASVTAKKLFTVSRVEGQQLLNIPNKGDTDRSSISSYSASPILTPDDAGSLLSDSTISQSDSLIYPTSLSSQENPARAITENLQVETMNHMIEQLVGISVQVDNNNDESTDQNTDSFQNQPSSDVDNSTDIKTSVTSDCKPCKENEKIVTHACNNSSQSQDQSHVNSNGNIMEGNLSVDSVCDKKSSDDLRNPSEQVESDTCDVTASDSDKTVLLDSTTVQSGKDMENDIPQNCVENGIVVESDSEKNKDNLVNNLSCEQLKKEEQPRDSGIGSNENEHWTTVSPEPQPEKSKNTGHNEGNPDFYSSLTFNGLTQELASALENLDNTDSNISPKDTVDTEASCAADDFERELDQMLADVKSGTNLNLPENLTS